MHWMMAARRAQAGAEEDQAEHSGRLFDAQESASLSSTERVHVEDTAEERAQYETAADQVDVRGAVPGHDERARRTQADAEEHIAFKGNIEALHNALNIATAPQPQAIASNSGSNRPEDDGSDSSDSGLSDSDASATIAGPSTGNADQRHRSWSRKDRRGRELRQITPETELPLTPRRRGRVQREYAQHQQRMHQNPDLEAIDIPQELVPNTASVHRRTQAIVTHNRDTNFLPRGNGGNEDNDEDDKDNGGSQPPTKLRGGGPSVDNDMENDVDSVPRTVRSAASTAHNSLDCSSCARRRIRRQQLPSGVAAFHGARDLAVEIAHVGLAPFQVLMVVMVVLILCAGCIIVLAMLGLLMDRFLRFLPGK